MKIYEAMLHGASLSAGATRKTFTYGVPSPDGKAYPLKACAIGCILLSKMHYAGIDLRFRHLQASFLFDYVEWETHGYRNSRGRSV